MKISDIFEGPLDAVGNAVGNAFSSARQAIAGPNEQDLAKAPPGDPAGDYYKKLAALKTNPQWAGKQDLIQARINDIITRLSTGIDKGLPVNAQGNAEPETDLTKFQQKNPGFKESVNESVELDRLKYLIKQLNG